MKKIFGLMSVAAVLCATLGTGSLPTLAQRSGGSGGGGSTPKATELRVTGYVTAIDYEHSTITVGASYYGTGSLNVTPDTRISLDNVTCDFSSIRLGDWAEARYDPYTHNANKLTCTTVPTP